MRKQSLKRKIASFWDFIQHKSADQDPELRGAETKEAEERKRVAQNLYT